ncbi:hypothetical protein [Methylobacterium sp. JK268]
MLSVAKRSTTGEALYRADDLIADGLIAMLFDWSMITAAVSAIDPSGRHVALMLRDFVDVRQRNALFGTPRIAE